MMKARTFDEVRSDTAHLEKAARHEDLLRVVRATEPLSVVPCRLMAARYMRKEFAGHTVAVLTLKPMRTPVPSTEESTADDAREPVEFVVPVSEHEFLPFETMILGSCFAMTLTPLAPQIPFPDSHAATAAIADGPGNQVEEAPDGSTAFALAAARLARQTLVRYGARMDSNLACALMGCEAGRLSLAAASRWDSWHVKDAATKLAASAMVVAQVTMNTTPNGAWSCDLDGDDAVINRIIAMLSEKVATADRKYPEKRVLLMAVTEEVGEVNTAVQGLLLAYPADHKKASTPGKVMDECLDVAVVSARIFRSGLLEFQQS